MPSSRSRVKFRILKKGGKFYWQLQVRGEPVAQSTKGYASPRHARQAIEALGRHTLNAVIEENGE